VSVTHNQKITKSVAAQRLIPTRNGAKPEDVARICAQANLTNCTASAGMGLGWEVLNLNGEIIIQHSGSDLGVRTVALFVPAKNIGAIVFTNGENGNKVIPQVIASVYPNPLLIQVL
jgi:hypothetical protein